MVEYEQEDQDDFPEREELWEDEQWDDQDFELDEPEGGEVNLLEDDHNDKFSGFVLHSSIIGVSNCTTRENIL